MKRLIKALVHLVAPFYSLARIYAVELDKGTRSAQCGIAPQPSPFAPNATSTSRSTAASPASPLTLAPLESLGPGAVAFGITCEGALVSSCELWAGRSYHEPSIWMLDNDEALLTRLQTDITCRGFGLAGRLLMYLEREMADAGFQRLYAVVWWTNSASIKAFEKAHWVRVGFSVRVRFRFSKREFCWWFRAPARKRNRALPKHSRDGSN